MITAPKAPGAQVPNCWSSTPPSIGAMMRVELSMDAESPRIPPVSCASTALVSVEESNVLSSPPESAVGAMMISRVTTEGSQRPACQRRSHQRNAGDDQDVFPDLAGDPSNQEALRYDREHTHVGQDVPRLRRREAKFGQGVQREYGLEDGKGHAEEETGYEQRSCERALKCRQEGGKAYGRPVLMRLASSLYRQRLRQPGVDQDQVDES